MKRLLLLASALVACGETQPAEQYGFVALLGRDTVSVERVSRTHTRLVTDGVDRFPLVRLRHSEFDLSDDGHIRRMVMDVRTPSGKTPAERGRRITADFTGGTARISIRDSSGVRDTTWAIGEVLTVPHVSMMYSVIELEVASALAGAGKAGAQAGEPIRFRQFYPDRDIGASFALHQGFVQPLGGGKVELRHDWLSGIGELTVDSAGRMLAYSGARTTYQVAVTRTSLLPDITSIGAQFAAAEQRVGAAQLSVRDTVRASIGNATFLVDYSRPLARGRELLGKVIPFDYVWRTGANAATQFTTSVPVTLAGLSVPAGTYTLWTIPRANGAELIVNKQTGQWGTQYQGSSDLGRARLVTTTVADTAEKFTIAIDATDARRGSLSLAWGTFHWTAPIVIP
jgi:hypothetical protein